MPLLRRALPLALVALLGACVSLEEAPIDARPLTADRRILMVIYAAPGPIFVSEDSKAETAAKIVPGLGLIVKDTQDQRDLKASQDLQQYLPGFDAAGAFNDTFQKQIAMVGIPGRLVGPTDTHLPPETWRKLNAATDELDWQIKYYLPQPSDVGVSRNYSRYLELDDAVVLEVNLLYGLETEDDAYYSPTLKAVTKLLRANTMHQMWRHENIVDEPAQKLMLYDYKTKPNDLIFAWKRLMPALGNQIVTDLRKNLSAAGVSLDPRAGLPGVGVPGAAAMPGVPLAGPGWAPAPIASSQPPKPAAPSAFTPRPSTP